MEYRVTDLEIETICKRIEDGDLDLQPEFQRGEVWSYKKRQKLIDTILRGWQIPPIHLIEKINSVDEVLDGKQRLETIKKFFDGEIVIDGSITPFDEKISAMDKKTYYQLDDDTKRQFKKYSIRIIRLFKFKIEEPAELFYRLNQPVSLTSAEQRNAFIGAARDQVKEIVKWCEENGMSKESIGFNNSRMAYDDVLSKFCYTIEVGSIRKKITANDISEKYRSGEFFSDNSIYSVKNALNIFLSSISAFRNMHNECIAMNKATLFSWLLFTYRNVNKLDIEEYGELINSFETIRSYKKGNKNPVKSIPFMSIVEKLEMDIPFFESMFLLFNQRASMGSTDSSSVIIRDIILEIYAQLIWKSKYAGNTNVLHDLLDKYKQNQNLPLCLDEISELYNWGGQL